MSVNSKTWRVKWTSPTGLTGHGDVMYKYNAQLWADAANRDPQLKGWHHDIEDTDANK